MRINLASPYEDNIGYGVCGINLAIELSRLTEVNVTSFIDQASFGRPIETNGLLPIIRPTDTACDPELPTVYVQDVGERPPGSPVVLYTCLDTERVPGFRRASYRRMDHIAVMSAWNARTLREDGFENVTAVPQGVDTTLFRPAAEPRRVMGNRYLFFSGGKLEYRKGQDVVIAAWRRFHVRYPEALLVAGWHNPWPQTMQSMSLSPHIDVPPLNGPADMPTLVARNGIDPDSVLWLPALPNWVYPHVYQQCDCGLFPTRAEPATNLPMMELMACGRPVIATDCAGQSEMIEPRVNAIAMTDLEREPAGYDRPMTEDLGSWWSPSVDELVERMTWCIEHREEAASIGERAARDIASGYTWRHTAERLLEVVGQVAGAEQSRQLVG